MEITKKTQLTARVALLISAVSLCVTAWTAGCQTAQTGGRAESGRVEEKPLPDPPDTAQPAAAKTELSPASSAPETQIKDEKPALNGRLDGATGGNVRVKRLVVTTRVEQREPVQTSDFTAGQSPIVAFVELDNQSAEEHYVVVTFEHQEGVDPVGHVKLKVPAQQPRWRTWARTRMIRDAGEWAAVVRAEDGRELGRQSFAVQPS